MKTSSEIRNEFLKFFEQRGHKIVPSAPVIPYDDPTLLFTNAGMNQFKDIFLGTGKRDYNRAANSQKCIRVSGKHNDLEEVGRDTYHHTFFEMLGNWSFGYYYKEKAIEYAWELLTKVWKLDKTRLYVTVFETDSEAEELWKKVTDIDPSHVLRFGKKDNFWEMGETGPCGPCSEIHTDLSEKGDCGHLVNAGDPRVMEIWNLVFIQYNRDDKGTLTPLPAKHVDTGMGFERICAVLQGKKSNYETDIFMPIINHISDIVDRKYSHSDGTNFLDPFAEFDVAMRTIADHIRTLTFSIADGGIFSHEGRGYVMKKLLRRASLFGKTLRMNKPFIYQIVEAVVATMGEQFPEIKEKQTYIEKTIKKEEETFLKIQSDGIDRFYRNLIGERIKQLFIQQNKIRNNWWVDPSLAPIFLILRDASNSEEIKIELKKDIQEKLGIDLSISGDDAFKLHDTFGIPFDLTAMWAEDLGITIDVRRFSKLMEEQKERGRTARASEGNLFTGKEIKLLDAETKFVGYENNKVESEIIFSQDTEIDGTSIKHIALKETPFYTESGGQVYDIGEIEIIDSGRKYAVLKVFKASDGAIIHTVSNFDPRDGGQRVIARIDQKRRQSIMRNHTATHLLHETLRRVLGDHIQQHGSLVAPDRLRFDFNHFEKVTQEQIQQIEKIVNQKISEGIDVEAEEMPIEEAKKIPGIKMFFGEKYGDVVRVIRMADNFSAELCGGTHVKNTADIGLFKITSESSIASGIRRIEAVTGEGVKQYVNEQLIVIRKIDQELLNLFDEKDFLEKELSQHKKIDLTPRPKLSTPPSVDNPTRETIDEAETLLHKREKIVEQTNKEILNLKKELSKFRVKSAGSNIDQLVMSGISVDDFKIVTAKIEVANMDELKNMGDTLRSKLVSGVGVFGSVVDEKVAFVCVVTDDLIKNKKLLAGKIVGEIAKIAGGSGGGRPHLATAGAKDVNKLDEALEKTLDIIKSMTL